MNTKEHGVLLHCLCEVKDVVESILFLGSCINAILIPVIGHSRWLSKIPQFLVKYVEFFDTQSGQYIINCLILVFFIVKLFVTCHRNNKINNEIIIETLGDLHDKCIHDMRDHIHHLASIRSQINKENYDKLFTEEFKRLQAIATQFADQVSSIINGLMGIEVDNEKSSRKGNESVCACIKMIGNTESKPIAEKTVITLARSKNTPKYRYTEKNDKNIPVIGKNTDFLDLSEGYRNYYNGVRLREKFCKGEYNNTTENFKYESTIVVPIRFSGLEVKLHIITRKKVKQIAEINTKNDLDLTGYLCIDSEAVLEDWEDPIKVKKILKIMSVYADLMYIYMREFLSSFRIGEKNEYSRKICK